MFSDTTFLMPSPIDTVLPPTLTFLSNPISYYFAAAPPYNNVVLGALLFTPPVHCTPRLLLLQKGPYVQLIASQPPAHFNRKTNFGTRKHIYILEPYLEARLVRSEK